MRTQATQVTMLVTMLAVACGSPAPTHTATAPPPTPTVTKQEAPVQDDESRVRGFIAKLVANDWDGATALFDDTMRAALPKEKMAAIWHKLEESAGAFKTIDAVEITVKDPFHIGAAQASFERAPLLLRVVLDSQGRVSGFFVAPGDTAASWKPPTYANADAFTETRITVGTPALPGTLTVPRNAKNYPAVVLVHGSGPNDEDETIGANKPFKDLAWGLASRGVAVLRYDKRTRVDPAGVRTQKEEVDDAAHAAVALLQKQPDVDPKRIVVLGHSQGAQLGPRIAKNDPAIKGLVLLAAPTRSWGDLVIAQLQFLKAKPDVILQAQHFKATIESPTLKAGDNVAFPLGDGSSTDIPGAYFLDMRGYHPEKVAATLTIPLLVLQGERDYQVSVTADFPAWKAALAQKKNATLKTYPALNHLFCPGDGPPSPDEYMKASHVDEKVIVDIADFATKL
jgi:dienelactone hydrolase